MKVIYDFTDEQILQLYRMYQNEWWTKGRSFEDTASCVAGAQVCVGILDGNRQLKGFARVVTDFTFKAIIFDLIVSPEYRGAGLGRRLISLITKHENLKEVHHFELYCLPESQGFYEKIGFSDDLGGLKLMRLADR